MKNWNGCWKGGSWSIPFGQYGRGQNFGFATIQTGTVMAGVR